MSTEGMKESYRLAIKDLEVELLKEEMKENRNEVKIGELKFRINQKRKWLKALK